MSDQTDNNGMAMDEDQNQDSPGLDAGSSNAAPDSLLDEAPSGGALSKLPAAGTKADTQSRLEKSRGNMDNLSKQYAGDSQSLSDAYAQQKKTLQDATQRLLSMQIGPSQEEQRLRMASINGDAAGRYDPGAHNAAQANYLQAQRESEMQRQQLLAQYASEINKSQIGSSTANLNRDIQMMRVGQSDLNNASGQADKVVNAPAKVSGAAVWDPQGGPQGTGAYTTDATLKQNQQDTAAMKLKNALALKSASLKLNQGAMDDDTLNFVADQYNINHQLPQGLARAGVITQVLQRAQQRAAANGDSASAVLANSQLFKAQGDVLKDYQTGATHKQLDGLNTAVQHMNVFAPLIDTLNNNPVSYLNTLQNTWNSKVMGSPAPTSFNAVKEFVAGEVSKAVLPNGGGEREREAIANAVSSSNSPAALQDAVAKWKELLAGKTNFTKQNWDQATGGKFGAFEDKFLLPATREALGMQPKPAAAAPAAPRPGQQPAAPQGAQNPLVQYYMAVAAAKASGQPIPPKPAGVP